MKTLLKVAGILAAAFAVLLIAAAVALRVFLPPEKLKRMAISEADKSLHRELEVRSIGLSLVSGLRIEGLRLSQSPNFSKGELLRADSFTLSPDWTALLHRRLVVREIELDGAEVNVIKGRDGRLNMADLAAGPSAKSPPAGPPALLVGALSLKKVALHYRDLRRGSKADLALDRVKIEGLRTLGPFSAALDAHAGYAAAGRRYAVSLRAKGTVDLGGGRLPKIKADFPDISIASMGKKASASLRFSNAAAPKVFLTARLPGLDAEFLNRLAGGAIPQGAAVPPIKIEAALSYAAPRLDVSPIEVSAGGAEISGSASIADADAKTPRFRLGFSSNKFALSSLGADEPSLKRLGLEGKAALSLTAEGTAAAPMVSGLLSLDGVGARHRGQSLDNLTGSIRFTRSSAGGPALKTSGRLVVDQTIHPNFRCGKSSLSWDLHGVAADTRRLGGWVKLDVGPGRATRILDFASKSGGIVKALVVPLKALDKARALRIPGFNPPDLQDIPFTRIVGDYAAAGGVVTLRPFEIDGPVLGATTTGTIDLPARTVHLKAVTNSALGRIEFAVTGPLGDPSVRPDIAKAAQRQIKRLLRNRGKSLLENEGRALLKGLFH